MTFAQLS